MSVGPAEALSRENNAGVEFVEFLKDFFLLSIKQDVICIPVKVLKRTMNGVSFYIPLSVTLT